jgi:hypothetical protein
VRFEVYENYIGMPRMDTGMMSLESLTVMRSENFVHHLLTISKMSLNKRFPVREQSRRMDEEPRCWSGRYIRSRAEPY